MVDYPGIVSVKHLEEVVIRDKEKRLQTLLGYLQYIFLPKSILLYMFLSDVLGDIRSKEESDLIFQSHWK